MRTVLQRVCRARVTVEGTTVGEIDAGLLALVGVELDDGESDVELTARKIRELRIFDDDQGRMNRSLQDVGGQILVVSQFTLHGDCHRGRRPSYDRAAPPEVARRCYEQLLTGLRTSGVAVESGRFQARMAVELVNDGPVTLILDTRRSS